MPSKHSSSSSSTYAPSSSNKFVELLTSNRASANNILTCGIVAIVPANQNNLNGAAGCNSSQGKLSGTSYLLLSSKRRGLKEGGGGDADRNLPSSKHILPSQHLLRSPGSGGSCSEHTAEETTLLQKHQHWETNKTEQYQLNDLSYVRSLII